MTPRYGWTTFTLCYLIVKEEQQKPQQLGVLRNLYKRDVTSQATTHCGGCGKIYVEETEEVEIWICCDLCDQWCCGECENLQTPPLTDTYFCKKCC